jgi:hypothetical protein
MRCGAIVCVLASLWQLGCSSGDTSPDGDTGVEADAEAEGTVEAEAADADGDVEAETDETMCLTNSDCQDGVFCNGEETCSPETSTSPDGCMPAVAGPCLTGETCDETADACLDACDVDADRDDDGYDAVECAGTDCDDSDPDVHPGATEVPGDEADQDCDGHELCFEDLDGDGYRTDVTADSPDLTCAADGEAPASMAAGDCDDNEDTVHPGAAELPGDGIDNNCDGTMLCFVDADGDGYRTMDETVTVVATTPDCSGFGEADQTRPPTDCDDGDDGEYPGAWPAACSVEDRDCNGHLDNDNDGDGHVDITCASGDDCDDTDAAVWSGAWYDAATGYLWESPPPAATQHWDTAVSYCSGLSLCGHGAGEWHLPTVDESRTLIRGCPATIPGGTCGVTNSCLTASCAASCMPCGWLGGPGTGGCYADAGVGGGCSWYWTSSTHGDNPLNAWGIEFRNGSLDSAPKATGGGNYVRCVLP